MVGRETPVRAESLFSLMHCWRWIAAKGEARRRKEGKEMEGAEGRTRRANRSRMAVSSRYLGHHVLNESRETTNGWMGRLSIPGSKKETIGTRARGERDERPGEVSLGTRDPHPPFLASRSL